jgi:hypothetical protein
LYDGKSVKVVSIVPLFQPRDTLGRASSNISGYIATILKSEEEFLLRADFCTAAPTS